MPKAVTHSSTKKEAAANALKRNQACHQCRKKKLKCDAQQPCSACVKTHAFALKTNPTGAGEEPNCTYDSALMDANKLQELEAKIASLEGLLHNQQSPTAAASSNVNVEGGVDFLSVQASATTTLNAPSFLPSSAHSVQSPPNAFGTDPFVPMTTSTPASSTSMNISASLHASITPSIPGPPPSSPLDISGSATAVSLSDADFLLNLGSLNGKITPASSGTQPLPSPPTFGFQMIDPAWPDKIPPPELLHHLVETFFSCVPHAHRVLHRPTFMSQLLEHPSAWNFPHPVLLHAICAIASVYTPVVTDGSERNMWHVGPDTLFNSAVAQKRWVHDASKRDCIPSPSIYQRLDDRGRNIEESGFGMKHAEWCMDGWVEPARTGQALTQLLQSQLIISWYFHSVGRAVDLWIAIGTLCRMILPLGIHAAASWGPLSRQTFESLHMAHTQPTVIEQETYRNLFWLAYTTERVMSAGTVWPLSIQDDDISQYLPVRGSDFPGEFIPLSDRQRLSTAKAVVTHSPDITDSFTLYIKAVALLGKVKTFNGRFRTKYEDTLGGNIDPRETTEFQMLDSVIQRFKASFPKNMRDPVGVDGKLDPTLYMALVLPHVATILLHDPHADLSSREDTSAEKLLLASRDILDTVYKLTGTTYDLLLLDHSCSFCWFVCATTLMRFLKTRIQEGDDAEASKLSSEIQVVRFMLGNLGARTICGLRQIMILEDLYAADIEPLIQKSHGAATLSPVVSTSAPGEYWTCRPGMSTGQQTDEQTW